MFLSIIIPVYNEENLVLQVMDAIQKVNFPACVKEYEIVVVDDCSNDQTFERLTSYAASHQHISVFRHEINKGKGSAVKTGFKECKGDVILIQDADLELSPSDIPAMIVAMDQLNIDFINGSRYMPGLIRPLSSFKRYWFNRLFTFFISVLINIKLTDMACGYKLVSRKLLERINLRENRFGLEAELLIKAARLKKNNIAEVPVHYFPRNEGEGKKLRNMDGLRVFSTIVKYGLLRMN
jgi:glycosyltransferase involved in cell wall biosynthesis